MAGIFDESETSDFNINNLENYSDDQLNDHFDEISLAKDSLYKKYGDNESTPEYVRVIYEKSDIETRIIEKERDRREEMGSREDSLYHGKTLLLDGDIRYKNTDLGTLKTYGGGNNLTEFINTFITKDGRINKDVKGDNRDKATRFFRSYLSVSDGHGVRPLLGNYKSLELFKDITFNRAGSVKKGGLLYILRYKHVNVREVNINRKDTKRVLNEGTKEEKEFTTLVDEIFSYNADIVKKISAKTGIQPGVVQRTVDNDNSSFISVVSIQPDVVEKIIKEHAEGSSAEKISAKMGIQLNVVEGIVDEITNYEITRYHKNKVLSFPPLEEKMIEEMVIKKHKELKKVEPGSGLRFLRDEFKKIPDDLKDKEYSYVVLPEVVGNEIINNSVSKINSSLHSHAKEIESSALTKQEIREFSGILNRK